LVFISSLGVAILTLLTSKTYCLISNRYLV
jgi:hypothetical protein